MNLPKKKTVMILLCIFALVVNAFAVQMHLLCSVEEDQIVAEQDAIGNDRYEHEHECSHTAHHEPVSEKQDDDHCTPCVNDYYDISGKIRPGRELQLPLMIPVVVIRTLLPEVTASLLTTYHSLYVSSVFPPQYPPVKTVIRA